MTRAWLPHPAQQIRDPDCPTGRERFRTRRRAELAIDTYNAHTTSTQCTEPACQGGWHHTTRPPAPPPEDPPAATCEPEWTATTRLEHHGALAHPGPNRLRAAELADLGDQGAAPTALRTADDVPTGSYL